MKTLADRSQAVTNRDGQLIKKGTTITTVSSDVDKATGLRIYEVIDPVTGNTEVFVKEALDFSIKAARKSTDAVHAGPSTSGPSGGGASIMGALEVGDSTEDHPHAGGSTKWYSNCNCFRCFTKSASSGC